VDLVTLDLRMPGMQGEEVMRIVRREFPHVEIVIVTGHGSLESATEALRCGVGDYLQKPFDVVQVNQAVARCLGRHEQRDRLVRFLDELGEAVGHQDELPKVLEQVGIDPGARSQVANLLDRLGSEENGGPRLETAAFLEVLATTVESQSGFLRGHARRTAFYAGLVADALELPTEEREHVRTAGFLHDIGKIGVPSQLLMRPAALTPAERSVVERHPDVGARLVEPLALPTAVVSGIRYHHEWWDGRGYGDGLFGDQIPLSARIIALADAFDAMSCDRPYRKALPEGVVRRELGQYAGVQFDPALTREFLQIIEVAQLELPELAEAAGARVGRDESATGLHLSL
jgi:putative nucleotidyltransferase with HDIG domain